MTTTSLPLPTAIVMAAAWGSWGPSPLPSPRSHSVRVLKGPRCGRCQLLHQMSCSIKSSTPACRRWCRPSLSNGSSRTGSTPSVAPCARPRSQLPADSPDPLERTCKVHCPSCKRVHYESWRVSERADPVDCHSERRGHGKRGCPQRACGPDCQTTLQRFQTIGGSIGAQPHSRSERHYRPGAPTSPLPTRQCKEARLNADHGVPHAFHCDEPVFTVTARDSRVRSRSARESIPGWPTPLQRSPAWLPY